MLRFLLCLLALGSLLAPAASAQVPTTKPAAPAAPKPTAPPASPAPAAPTVQSGFFTTYTYHGFLVYDQSAGPEPIVAEGVSGTLALRPDGSYEKHLQVQGQKGPVRFDQQGRFTLTGVDNITFDYTDAQGKAKSDLGTYRLDPEKRTLELTIVGFPPGNRGVYQLTAPKR